MKKGTLAAVNSNMQALTISSTDRTTIITCVVAWLVSIGIIAFSSVWVPAVLIIIILVMTVLLARPVWTLYLFAATIPFDRIPLFTVAGSSFSASKIVGIALILVWLQQLQAGKGRTIHFPKTLTILLVLYSGWSSLVVINTLVSDGFRLNEWFGLIVPFSIPFILAHFCSDMEILRRFWTVYAAAMTFSAIVAWIQFTTGSTPFGLSRVRNTYVGTTLVGVRPTGTFDDPNYFALASTVATGIWLMQWKLEAQPWKKNLFAALAMLCASAVVLSLSRGGIAGLTIIILVFLLQAPERARNLLIFTVIVAVGYVMLANSSLMPAIQARYGDSAAALERGRQAIWQLYIASIWENPVFGVGVYRAQELFRASHNLLLGVTTERGIVAGISMLGIVATAIMQTYRSGSSYTIVERATFSTILAVLLGYIMQSMLLKTENQKELWFLIGTVIVLVDQYRARIIAEKVNKRTVSGLAHNQLEIVGGVK